jgi:hypothetical protein
MTVDRLQRYVAARIAHDDSNVAISRGQFLARYFARSSPLLSCPPIADGYRGSLFVHGKIYEEFHG